MTNTAGTTGTHHFDWKVQLMELVGIKTVAAESAKAILSPEMQKKLKKYNITTKETFTAAMSDPGIRLGLTSGVGSWKPNLNTFLQAQAEANANKCNSSSSENHKRKTATCEVAETH